MFIYLYDCLSGLFFFCFSATANALSAFRSDTHKIGFYTVYLTRTWHGVCATSHFSYRHFIFFYSCIREFQDVNYGDDDGRDRDDSELLKTRQKRRGGKRKDMKESEKNGNRQLYT